MVMLMSVREGKRTNLTKDDKCLFGYGTKIHKSLFLENYLLCTLTLLHMSKNSILPVKNNSTSYLVEELRTPCTTVYSKFTNF